MKPHFYAVALAVLLLSCQSKTTEDQSVTKASPSESTPQPTQRQTVVSIEGEQFFINGKPTFEGRTWNGYQVEGLLPNSRMVQGIFDDENPETVDNWQYPDTNQWDPVRNTDEFVAAMESWHEHGLLGFTINLQGGSPLGYGNKGWRNTAFNEDGSLKPAYMSRLEKILNKADTLGMVPILGLFYFGQDEYLADREGIISGVNNALDWLFEKGYRNVIIELANEVNNRKYDQPILKADSVHVLMEIVRNKEKNGYRYLVGTSFNGNTLPTPNVLPVSDFVLIHGNGVKQPDRIVEMVEQVRAMESYRPMPIVFNEDDHFDFDKDWNNFIAATSMYASWGYFDFRMEGEGFENGFQSVPVDWRISSPRKKAFFDKVKQMTGK